MLDDFGERLGRVWCDTNEKHANRSTLIRDVVEGSGRRRFFVYIAAVRIVAFNAEEDAPRPGKNMARCVVVVCLTLA